MRSYVLHPFPKARCIINRCDSRDYTPWRYDELFPGFGAIIAATIVVIATSTKHKQI
jgi:hypothetical protein